MSYLYSKLPETGVSPHIGTGGNSTGGTATLNNGGSIGALSDRAVASTPPPVINNKTIINNDGIITGFVQQR